MKSAEMVETGSIGTAGASEVGLVGSARLVEIGRSSMLADWDGSAIMVEFGRLVSELADWSRGVTGICGFWSSAIIKSV